MIPGNALGIENRDLLEVFRIEPLSVRLKARIGFGALFPLPQSRSGGHFCNGSVAVQLGLPNLVYLFPTYIPSPSMGPLKFPLLLLLQE